MTERHRYPLLTGGEEVASFETLDEAVEFRNEFADEYPAGLRVSIRRVAA